MEGGSSGYEELHRLNPYRANRPDALHLARHHPELFEPYFEESGSRAPLARVDWTSSTFAAAVTRALLLHDFGIRCELPIDRLCPPVPNRLNYLCWLRELLHDGPPEELLPVTIPLLDTHNSVGAEGVVLDIGVGSSCIYPLLGRRLFGWSFVCSDIDEGNARNAAANAKSNAHFVGDSGVVVALVSDSEELQRLLVQRFVAPLQAGGEVGSLAALVASSPHYRGPARQALLALDRYRESATALEETPPPPGACEPEPWLDAVMTNPPFYCSAAEIGRSDHSVCTGAAGEMVTEGGELAFVLAVVADSIVLRGRCRWYSAMVGVKADLAVLQRVLRSERLLGADALPRVRSCRFTQGLTMRWGLAWSWRRAPPRDAASHSFEVSREELLRSAAPEELSTCGARETALLHSRISAALADPAVARAGGACRCGPFVEEGGGSGQHVSVCRVEGAAAALFTIRTTLLPGSVLEVRIAGPGGAAVGERLQNEVLRDNRRWRRKRQRDASATGSL